MHLFTVKKKVDFSVISPKHYKKAYNIMFVCESVVVYRTISDDNWLEVLSSSDCVIS